MSATQHEYWTEPDDKYQHLLRPRCSCGWHCSGTMPAVIAKSFFARHIREAEQR